MNRELNVASRAAMQSAAEFARDFRHEQIEPEHLLLALLESGDAADAPESGGDVLLQLFAAIVPPGEDGPSSPAKQLRADLERRLEPGGELLSRGRIPQSPWTERLLQRADEQAGLCGADEVAPVHLLLGIAGGERGPAVEVLHSHGGLPAFLRETLQRLTAENAGAESRPEPLPPTIPLAPDEPRVNGNHDAIRALADDASPLDYREFPQDARLYLPQNEGWQARVKQGWEQTFCYTKNPGEDYFHLLLAGEIYLQRGDEKLCLNCALRHGLVTTDRLYWQRRPSGTKG